MVAINEILLPECTGEECGGDSDICMASRVHHRNAENRAPVARNHRSAPILGRWMEQGPAQYIDGANTYQFVVSNPVGNVDAGGLAFAGQRRIIGDTFALRPALRHSSPGLIHTEQRAVRDMGAVTAIAGLPDALNDLSEGASDILAWEDAVISGDEGAMNTATSEWGSFLLKYESKKIFDSMEDSIRDLMKSDLKGYGNKAAPSQGWAVWVRVEYQQYQYRETGFWLWACKKPEWVNHHQWVRVPVWYPHLIEPLNGYPANAAGISAIAYQLPWMYAYANRKVLNGGAP